MALSAKQRKILKAGSQLSKSPAVAKDIVDYIEDNVTGSSLTNLVAAIKTDLLVGLNSQKTGIDNQITGVS